MTEHERAWPISLKNVKVTDPFWNLYIRSVPAKMIPYQWRILNDCVEDAEMSGCIRNFRIAAGDEKGRFHGFVFQDTDLAKWLEAVAYSLSLNKDPDLEREADGAMADLAWEYKDDTLLEACEVLYEDIVMRQMYLTGGIGSSGLYERFTTAYDLPSDRNYAESCASIGLAMFCSRMAQITHEEKYIGTMETALYNTVAAATALDGEHFFYVNPLEVWPDNCLPYTSMAHVKPVRQKWFGCACCTFSVPKFQKSRKIVGDDHS